MKARGTPLDLRHWTLYALLGTIMLLSKVITEPIPNVHLLAVFTVTFTVVYRKYALIPIYFFVFLVGLIYAGFSTWWVPYLYLWTVLWGVAMLLPRNMKPQVAIPVYMLVCGLHGLAYGTLYAPCQALFFGLNFKGTLAWIAAGFPWDCIHAASNFCLGVLVFPLVKLMTKLEEKFF